MILSGIGRWGLLVPTLLLLTSIAGGEGAEPEPPSRASSPFAGRETGRTVTEWFTSADGARRSLRWTPLGETGLVARLDSGPHGGLALFHLDRPWETDFATGVAFGRETIERGRLEGRSRVWARGERREAQRLPVPAATELQLALVLRKVDWRFGETFTTAVLWAPERAGGDEPEPVRRATVRCVGRETIRSAGEVIPCWRVVVESQGRKAPIRGLFWISVAAPGTLERWETSSGLRLERVRLPPPSPKAGERGSTDAPGERRMDGGG